MPVCHSSTPDMLDLTYCSSWNALQVVFFSTTLLSLLLCLIVHRLCLSLWLPVPCQARHLSVGHLLQTLSHSLPSCSTVSANKQQCAGPKLGQHQANAQIHGALQSKLGCFPLTRLSGTPVCLASAHCFVIQDLSHTLLSW